MVKTILLLVTGLACIAARAQTPVVGKVTYNGKAVPGAIVTVQANGKSFTTTTGEDGSYLVEGVPDGPAMVAARIFGFQRIERELTAAQRPARVDLPLTLQAFNPGSQPGGRGAGANGSAAAGGENSVETQVARSLESAPAAPLEAGAEASESFLVQGSMSRGLQEAERPAFFEFGPGGPGGMMGGPGGPGGMMGGPEGAMGGPGGMGGPEGGPGGGGMMAGPGGGGMRGGGFGGPGGGGFGGRGGDGGPAMGPRMSPDQLQKMRPEEREKFRREMAQRMPAAFRREGFGNRSRRVRDQIRGGAFFTFRGDTLDAAPFALNGRTSEKPNYTQMRYGVSLGGPLALGKIFTQNTSFFFLNYSGNRGDQVYNGYSVQPVDALRAGDFSVLTGSKATTIYDPLTLSPFPGNKVPAARISSVASGLLPYIPLPTTTGVLQNYSYTTTNPQNSDDLSFRLNRTLTKKDRLSGSLNWQRRASQSVQLFGWKDSSEGNGLNTSVSWSHNFSSRLITNASIRYNNNYNALLPYFAYGTDVAGVLGIAGTSRDPVNYGPPNLNFTNFGDLNDGNRSSRHVHTFSISDGWTFVRKTHTITTGFDFTRTQQNTLSDPNARGTLFFGGLATSGFDSAGLPLSKTGNDLADFLLGYVQQSTIRYGSPDTYLRQTNLGAYVQDEWRAKPRLTFNLGLRYDDWEPFTEKYSRMANIDFAPDLSGAVIVTPGSTGTWHGIAPAGLIQPDRNNFSPRIGVSWRPFKKRRTILRGGYSLFFDGSTYSRVPSRLIYQPPFATSSTFNTSLEAPLKLNDPFQGPADTTILNSYAVNPNYTVPYAQTWNFSVQHEIHGYIVELGLLGTKGTKLVVQRIPNRAAPGSSLNSENRRPIPYATGFTYDSPEGSSIFNAGQLRVVRRMRRGVNWSFLYTYGKSIDNASSIGGSGNTVVQNDQDLAAERGLSAFDVRHNFQFNAMVTSPWGPNGVWLKRRNALTAVLRDWNLNTSINANTGRPLTARVLGSVADAAGTGATGSARADATGQAIDSGSGYFNTAAFAIPPANRYGNAGRNTIPGPGSFMLNASFGRSFQVGESTRHRLEGRLEATNLLNHVNITSYGTVVNAANYGLATAAGNMRSIQLTVRFRF
ncbi:MAG: TonB-dependent receptor [Acidobacteria bacterium]|nr:TonB-dependent receptor [Acidobacteriota bacterium]